GCVHNTIEREALQALSDGRPRLVRLSPERHVEEGVESYPMTCHSGGTLDIYLEPVLPAARLVVFGDSPVADALRTLAEPLGFNVLGSVDSATDTNDAWVVAAAMGSDEDYPTVRAALECGIGYVALVS